MYRLLRATGSFLSRYLNRQTLGAYPHPAADVALVEGKRRISTAIKYLTQSSWSHAAIYVGKCGGVDAEGRVRALVEADMEHGVRAFSIEELEGLHLRICRPMGLSSQDARQVVSHVLGRLGDKYDLKNVFDLARYLLPTPPVPTSWRRRMLALGSSDPTRAICSTLIAEAFEAVGFPIPPIMYEKSSMFAITAYSSHATSTFRHTSRSSSRAHAATIVLQSGLTPIRRTRRMPPSWRKDTVEGPFTQLAAVWRISGSVW